MSFQMWECSLCDLPRRALAQLLQSRAPPGRLLLPTLSAMQLMQVIGAAGAVRGKNVAPVTSDAQNDAQMDGNTSVLLQVVA